MFFEFDKSEPVRICLGEDQQEWVEFRILTDEEINATRKKVGIRGTSVYVPNPAKENALEIVPAIIDQDKQNQFFREMNFQQICGWRLIGKDGTEIPRTLENVDMMLTHSSSFAKFVTDNIRKIKSDMETGQQAEIKNSSTTQNGSEK